MFVDFKIIPKLSQFYEVNFEHVYACVFNTNNNEKYPYLQYLLFNDTDGQLNFLKVPSSNNQEGMFVMYSMFYLTGKCSMDNIEFKGYYSQNNTLYLFFDASKTTSNIDDIYLKSPYRWALIDEIINDKKVCNITVNSNVVNLLLLNQDMFYLYNEKNEPYQIPMVAYVGKPTEKKIEFTSIFGENPQDKSAILGPYYYFTNFHNAFRKGGWSNVVKGTTNNNEKCVQGGIVRFALFLNKTKIIENTLEDTSLTKQMRLNDPLLDKNNEMKTAKIADHDGEWTTQYDSVIIGDVFSNIVDDVPMYIIKEYDQQIVLSYHYIDKKSLGNAFDKNNMNYKIK